MWAEARSTWGGADGLMFESWRELRGRPDDDDVAEAEGRDVLGGVGVQPQHGDDRVARVLDLRRRKGHRSR
eukprot:1666737-Prymnesium_polylepis.1